MSETPIACAFCGKGREAVHRLVGGPHAYICDECVDRAEELLEKEEIQEKEFEQPSACALCHLPAPIDALLAILERGFLCAICLEAIRVAAEESQSRKTGN